MLVDEPRPRGLPLAVYYFQMDHHGDVTISTQGKEHPPRPESVRQNWRVMQRALPFIGLTRY